MAEEKEEQQKPVEAEQEKAAEKKPEAKPKTEEKVEAKAEAKAESKPAEAAPEKKRRKISGMTLKEVEAELKITQEKMGGFQSHFAKDLLARKKVLAESPKRS